MPTITQSVMVNRPVEEVWDFIGSFENTTRWSRGVLEARQTSDGPLGVGSTLQTVVKAFGRRRTAERQPTCDLRSAPHSQRADRVPPATCILGDAIPPTGIRIGRDAHHRSRPGCTSRRPILGSNPG